jgi:quinol monooxygenase YgiN
MIMIVGTLRIPTAKMPTARPALARLMEQTRKEQGCLDFAFSESLSEPGLIHLAERWADRAALEAHWQAPSLKEFRPVAEGLGVSDRNVFLYEVASQTKL